MAYNKAADKEGAPAKRRPMHRRKKVCVFCGKDNVIDYKDTNKLKRYISERGKILPRRITGNCAKHQSADRCDQESASRGTDAVCMRLTKDDRRFRDICPGIFCMDRTYRSAVRF